MTPPAGATDALAGGGALVGPYRLERALGRGGMGLVFLAHRADEQYEKRVAIKLLSGASREHALLRFRAERQILAKLDHPHIARMLDGGVTADGEPYFVMDYVPGGEAIDDYCDHHKLSVRSRVQLFLTVCDAVHYAHRFLVVHRDLKPSNIQVSREGVAKLVDFGIAKDLLAAMNDGDAEAEASTHGTGTVAGRPMTPGYASPEQMRGEPIGTASDIYALGVVLYELLAGATPYQTPSGEVEALLREVSEGKIVPPSQAYARRGKEIAEPALSARGLTRPKQLERILAGDLDAIVGKAMACRAQDRYASADQLAEDLRRFLDGGLVRAAEHNSSYRVKKFFQRYRAISSAVATVMFCSMVLAVGMAALALKNYLDVIEARIERNTQQQVVHYLAGAYANAEVGAPSTEALLAAVKQLGNHAAGEPGWKEPARLALAESLVGAGGYAESVGILESLVTGNLGRFTESNPERVLQMALLGEALAHTGQPKEAAGWFRRALDARRELTAIPDNVPTQGDLETRLNRVLTEIRR